jgi:hypothetical protein
MKNKFPVVKPSSSLKKDKNYETPAEENKNMVHDDDIDKEILDEDVDKAMEVLLKAEQHKQNKKLMHRVHSRLGSKSKAITSLQDLKNKKAELDQE